MVRGDITHLASFNQQLTLTEMRTLGTYFNLISFNAPTEQHAERRAHGVMSPRTEKEVT